MRGTRKYAIAGLIALASTLGVGEKARAGDAVISTNPPAVIAPVINYTLYVRGDNTQLTPDGTVTTGVQWKLYAPVGGYTNVLTANLPSQDKDFFQGFDMWQGYNNVNLPGTISNRSTDIIAHGGNYAPGDKAGDLGVYTFNINNYTGAVTTDPNNPVKCHFYVGLQKFLSSSGTNQPLSVVNNDSIVGLGGDNNLDGIVDLSDLARLGANWTFPGSPARTWYQGDFNNDGVTDLGDLAILGAHWTEGGAGQGVSQTYMQSTGIPTPDAFGAGVLAFAAMGLVGARGMRRASYNVKSAIRGAYDSVSNLVRSGGKREERRRGLTSVFQGL